MNTTKKLLASFLISWLAIIPVMAQDLNPYQDSNGKWGFTDIENNIVIDAVYEKVWGFEEGMAAVKKDSKWGYIDKTGKVVIPFKYDEAESFSEGLALVGLNDKYGFINHKDEIKIPFKFDFAVDFYEGKARVKIESTVFDINHKGECVLNCENVPKEYFEAK